VIEALEECVGALGGKAHGGAEQARAAWDRA